jgi:hypothetical protein
MLWVFLLAGGWTAAEEQIDVCAEYTATGKHYKVKATKATGSELNSATHSFEFDSFSTYIVIFWDKGEATIINVGSFPSLMFGVAGKDQEEREWNVSTSTSFCY